VAILKIGIIARSDNTGLGNQTRELVKMLNPTKILLINSYFFNRNKQNLDWYKDYECITTEGFASNEEVVKFLDGLDVVISCEIFYNPNFIALAKRKKVKTILQYNYEFLDHLSNPALPLPDILVAPSLWNFDDVAKKFGHKTKVVYLPPPTDHTLFEEARRVNINKDHKRILHIGGKAAVKDRNGTNTVLDMLKYSVGEYEVVVKSQTELKVKSGFGRFKLDINNVENNKDLYMGFDALILPRRYAGLCLPMNEALMASLPVFMTNISPNNQILPSQWLVESNKIDELMTRTMIDVYSADPEKLANTVDSYMDMSDKTIIKQQAFDIGFNNFSAEILKEKYLELFNQ
jgi:glycosyltransferase involved in cell wall biosynthesis